MPGANTVQNLNNVPKQRGEYPNLLRHLSSHVPGLTAPQLGFGMVFSSTCWRLEQHMMYSATYHHHGEAKTWYAVPASGRAAFEATAKKELAEAMSAQPDLLLQGVAMVLPSALQAAGVPVFSVVQEPGTFIVTLPGAYHAEFSHGLNCTESIAFAPPDWLRFAHAGSERLRLFRKPQV